MLFLSERSHRGVRERQFTLDDIPGVLWSPEAADGPLPLILIGHGGGQHKQAPEVAGRAYHFVVEGGFAVAAVDAPDTGDDERIPRRQSLALFDALGSADKTLHANPGKHSELPSFETDSSLRFFVRHFSAGTKNAA